MDELSNVLWAYSTTPRSVTQEIPFFLTYGAKVVVPVEVLVLSPKVTAYVADDNSQEREVDLDLVEEKREEAMLKMV